MNYTSEQLAALDTYAEGNSMVVSAFAGTGKTSTILALAATDQRRGTYVAYNKAIVTDVEAAMHDIAPHIQARTAHSLAYGAIGHNFRSRLGANRMSSREVAKLLDLVALDVTTNGHTHRLSAAFLAGCVMDGIRLFCNSADLEPSAKHLPAVEAIDEPDSSVNDTAYREALTPALERAWADLSVPHGSLRFSHDCYLKLWQLSVPTIPGEVLFVDEAQDVNPALSAVLEGQTQQIVVVGDSYQQIYEWRGAVDALGRIGRRPGMNRAALTHSFRFGPEIAGIANSFLYRLGAQSGITGEGGPSSVERSPWPNAILCRTNAGVINALFSNLNERDCAIVGGGGDIVAFAKGYIALRDTNKSSHPELVCFDSISELAAYVTNDPSGSDLALLVKLCSDFGPEQIITTVQSTVAESSPDALILSTAHKAKGREWDDVRLASDWTARRLDTPEELRLAYVATTRAKTILDLTETELQ